MGKAKRAEPEKNLDFDLFRCGESPLEGAGDEKEESL